MRVLDFLLNGILVYLSLLLPFLKHLFLACQVYLLDFAMEGQLFLKFFEIGLREEVIVNFLLVVPEFHKIGKMKGYVSELFLIVFMEDLLDVLHVLVG